jgi:hypothetical protein
MIVAKALGKIFSDINKKKADLDPFGGKYTPMEKYSQKKRLEMLDKMMSNSDNDKPSKPSKPDAKAAARARMIAEGKEKRKKFEKEKGSRVAKRRKLLLKIKDSQ